MTNSLYTEALSDAKAVREAAEERAKQQLVESMSPKIKLMVEKALLGEKEIEEKDLCEDDPEDGTDDKGEKEKEEKDKEELDEAVVDAHLINMDSYKVVQEMKMKSNLKKEVTNKIEDLQEALKRLKPGLLLSETHKINSKTNKKLNKIMNELLSEVKYLKSSEIVKSDRNLLESYNKLKQEFLSMYKRRRNKLNESIDSLFEAEHAEEGAHLEEEVYEADLDELEELEEVEEVYEGDIDEAEGDDPLALDDEEAAEEDAAGAPAGDAIARSDLEPIADSLGSAADELRALLAGDEEGEEEGDEAEELALGDLEEPAEDAEGEEEDLDEGDVFLEIDESMLRNEIAKMKALREGDAADMAAHFGGGKKEQEAFVDGEDLNKHDHVSTIKESARKVARQNRQLQKALNEHKKALSGMKAQLQEMNLFNAKLLYANKLMQNKDLSLKQQKHIVESLDNAKTLREAKVLFEGLTKSLNKGSSRTGALTEGTSRRVLGTSSRSTRSAQPANNRVEVDRWALLAGIKG